MQEAIRPLYARLIGKDTLTSQVTGERFHRVRFNIKFNDGNVEEIVFNTTSDFKKLMSTEKINGMWYKPVALSPWQDKLFNCWTKTEDTTRTILYTCSGSEWGTDQLSREALAAVFFVPEPKSSCSIS